VIDINGLPGLVITPRETPPEVRVRPVIGGKPEAVMTLDRFRAEYPLLRSKFIFARELFEATNPEGSDLQIGPTFEELLDVASQYVDRRISVESGSDFRDIGIYYWTRRGLDVLETAVRQAPIGTAAVPILGLPEYLDSSQYRRKTWTGVVAEGKKCPLSKVPCHTALEASFAGFLDAAPDVVRYMKNEFFGFSLTYYENNRPRQYFPDFIVQVRDEAGRDVWWLAETKGEIRPNTAIKREAANLWCEKMTAAAAHGTWRHLFAPQRAFEKALASGAKTFSAIVEALFTTPEPQLRLVEAEEAHVARERFKTLLPLYSLKAAAGYFGNGEAVQVEAWIEVDDFGPLDEQMFVARAVGRSMEPKIHDGDYCVFRAKPSGTRQGKIVLAQYRGPADPETGGAFTVKRYRSEKEFTDDSWQHARIVLEPFNRAYEPIVVTAESEDAVQVLAEFLGVLGP
jgi:SOS-response transcriptional repressor LexA